ncbi:hypothetical protein [Nocardia sp. NPDC002869]|uniref:hypothetical protein n=1 Tax=Nocardia sp. NPDC002869 TaxID=3161032 RepID=UPI00398CE5DB
MEKSSREWLEHLAADAVKAARQAAGKLSGDMEAARGHIDDAVAKVTEAEVRSVAEMRDAVGQEILDSPMFSRTPLAGPRYYLRKIVGEDLDFVIQDMRRDGVNLRDAAAMNRWLEQNYTPRDANAMDRWLEEKNRPRGEVTETDARSAGKERDVPTPQSQPTGDRPQVIQAPFRDETAPTVTKTEGPTGQEILDSPMFSGKPLAGARYYLRKIVGEDLDFVIQDMRRDGVNLRDAAAMDRWLEEKYRPRG